MSHIGFAERIAIEAGLARHESLAAIAKQINVQPRAVSEEIRKNKSLLPAARYNGKDCKFADECRRRFVCGNTRCLQDCVLCEKVDCCSVYSVYSSLSCHLTKKPPYVCNTCNLRRGCKSDKAYYDATYYQNRLNGAIPVERNAWWVDYNDPDNVLYSYFSRRAQEGTSVGMTAEWVFNMLDDARREVDSEKRLGMYQEIEKYLVDNVCFIPIFQPQLTVIIQPNISNYTPAWNGWTSTCYYGIEKN